MPAEGRKSVGLSWGSLAILFAAVALNFSFMTGGSFWSWFVREVKGYIQVSFQGFLQSFGNSRVTSRWAVVVYWRFVVEKDFYFQGPKRADNISHKPVGLVGDHVPDNPASQNLAGHVDSGAGLAPFYHHHACLVPANVRPGVVHRFP